MNRYGKQQCLHMDWNDSKEITAEELAYCIQTHDLNIDNVPAGRLDKVKKELLKLKYEENQQQQKRLIKYELAIYNQIEAKDKVFGISMDDDEDDEDDDKIVGSKLDPRLFQTNEEAMLAMDKLNYWIGQILTGIHMYNDRYKNTSRFSRDKDRMYDDLQDAKKKYVKNLLGDASVFDEWLSTLPMPEPLTLQKTIYKYREEIALELKAIGVSSTRAKDIAVAITKAVYKAVYKAVK